MSVDKQSVCFISFSDIRGGAAKAADRIKNSLLSQGYSVRYIVAEKNDRFSDTIGPSKLSYYNHFFFRCISFLPLMLIRGDTSVKRSLNLFSSSHVIRQIEHCDFLHIHWVNNDTLSIGQLSKLWRGRTIVMTLHDEWLYCGTEHCASDFMGRDEGFSNGYSNVDFWDWSGYLNKYFWMLKKKLLVFNDKVVFTVPSTWMKERVEKSLLLRGAKVSVVPNPIPLETFNSQVEPINRSDLGISDNDFIISFGSVQGRGQLLKGGDILQKSLNYLWDEISSPDRSKVKLLVFGGNHGQSLDFKFPLIHLNHIDSAGAMAEIYRASDLVVVPSRVESFGQVAAESLACGTPVVAFNCSGLMDIIDHKKNGYLADAYDYIDLARGINWILNLSMTKREGLSRNGVRKVELKFSESVVASKFIDIYSDLI